ncbi:LacI family DNA-binding transcriptional regulator [Janthinobacterium aquaticum]|uniref:LacI family DNA-binding transcriptional regulator n=1 Tax=Janthinobacterium sp. FT58W TaxID=2654254 RepID=UPI00126529FA|nr:substrate-binding domain-containing protein [Janthinobacterium sp. FT58W]KAB8041421.1 LacI family DNA-binding transcriptional regulator [Janthinobacterium sp. FT58W]
MNDTSHAAPPSTLLDVARQAGVSPSTVSRILNGTARVSDDKRDAVLAAIAQMKFAPNQMAQALKKGRSMTIGIVVQDISSPFFDESLRGVDDGLKDTGYASVIVSGHWNAQEEADRIRLLLARKVDGIILLSGRISDDSVLEFSLQRPVVSTGRQLATTSAIGFKLDNEYGAWLAVRHLIELGHRRIAFIAGPANNTDAAERLAGYQRALREADIALEPKLVAEGDFHEASGMLAMNHLFDTQQQFSAVFAANDLSAYGARLCLYRKGIRVPDDISLVGFDDLPGSSYTTPPLTTIRQPLYDIGRIATETLLGLIHGETVRAAVPPLELVVRETTRRVRG